jgi:hypothetical protein
MTADEDAREITVKAPSKPVVSPEKKAEKATEKSLEEERYGVLQIRKKVGEYLGALAASVGVLLLCLIVYTSLTDQTSGILLTARANTFSLGLWIFTGVVNIVVGLLLMGSE